MTNYIKNETRTISIAKVFYFSHEFDTKINFTFKRLKKDYFPREYTVMFCNNFEQFFKDFQLNYNSVYPNNFGPFDNNVANTWAIIYNLLERTTHKVSLLKQWTEKLNHCAASQIDDLYKGYFEEVITPFVDDYELLLNTIKVFEKFDDMLDGPFRVFDKTLDEMYEALYEYNTPSKDLKYNIDRYLPEGFRIVRED